MSSSHTPIGLIALIAGGYSGEYAVSLRSQATLLTHLRQAGYDVVPVCITRSEWIAIHDDQHCPIDRDDFTFTTSEGTKHTIDFAYITIHGTPGEDGLLTGYLDMLAIPYSCCPTLTGALTFNKYFCNHYLSSFGIPISESLLLRAAQTGAVAPAEQSNATLQLPICEADILRAQSLCPAFVKPNVGGSSLATSRVDNPSDMRGALHKAFGTADEVIVERLITGIEVTCGAYRDATGLHILPITEVVTKNSFFDYDAKYNGAVEEITPARISSDLSETISRMTSEIYDHLGAEGIIRVDYIIQSGQPILLEVNTTPGMTETSFIPQQIRAAGLTLSGVLHDIIEYIWHKNRK